jgi:hypothetical protein
MLIDNQVKAAVHHKTANANFVRIKDIPAKNLAIYYNKHQVKPFNHLNLMNFTCFYSGRITERS